MIVFPALDLKEGAVVRLREGDPQQKTVYSQHPLEVAQRWQTEGADWLHVVNLDGALSGEAALWDVLQALAKTGLRLQFGGGLRDTEAVASALKAGAERVVVGTAAVAKPSWAGELVAQFGTERIVVALDARGGKVTTHGWQNVSAYRALDLALTLKEVGVRHLLYTDVGRDGLLTGLNFEETLALAEVSGLAVIASGGVAHVDEVRRLASVKMAGVILGKALYEGRIHLREALQAAQEA
jgi:phosphoribosylformimino-5-aminoimidazole carboxamide ribotide isomerase